MARYKMRDDTIADTTHATHSWQEDTYHDGRNWISRASGTQRNHETLYRSRKGRYYLEYISDWQGSHDSAEWVTGVAAARWLLVNNYDVPDELKKLVDQVME